MKIPYFKQKTDYSCGAACVRMILQAVNIKKSEQTLAKKLKTNKTRGTSTKNLINLFKNFNFQTISKQNSSISRIKKLLKQNYSVILLFFIENEKIDHFAIVKKITKNKIFLQDPYLGKNSNYPLSKFSKIWHSDSRFEKKKKWFLAVKSIN